VTDLQVKLIQLGWQQVLPEVEAVATTFYDQLFRLQPPLRRLFPTDFQQQVDKMAATIETIVTSLDRLDLLLPQVQLLGVRHAYYRVEPEHYALVAQALLSALAEHLGEHWSTGMAEAWKEAYWLLAETMQEAQASVRRQQHGGLRA
jgi:hemoglobin-like flavoprotein